MSISPAFIFAAFIFMAASVMVHLRMQKVMMLADGNVETWREGDLAWMQFPFAVLHEMSHLLAALLMGRHIFGIYFCLHRADATNPDGSLILDENGNTISFPRGACVLAEKAGTLRSGFTAIAPLLFCAPLAAYVLFNPVTGNDFLNGLLFGALADAALQTLFSEYDKAIIKSAIPALIGAIITGTLLYQFAGYMVLHNNYKDLVKAGMTDPATLEYCADNLAHVGFKKPVDPMCKIAKPAAK